MKIKSFRSDRIRQDSFKNLIFKIKIQNFESFSDSCKSDFIFPKFSNSEDVEKFTKTGMGGSKFADILENHVAGLNVSTNSNHADYEDLPTLVSLQPDGHMVGVKVKNGQVIYTNDDLPNWTNHISILSQR